MGLGDRFASVGDKLKESLGQVKESIARQEWFQQLKAKWDELDADSRFYIQCGAGAGAVLLVVFMIFGSWWSIRSKRQELTAKNELMRVLQSANDEIRRLKDLNASMLSAAEGGSNWKAFFDQTATSAGMDPSVLSVSPEKKIKQDDLISEVFFQISLKKINVRQLSRFAYFIENGGKPVRMRTLQIDTSAENDGYLSAEISVSAFSSVAPAAGAKSGT